MDYTEFVQARKHFLGASDAAAVMGVSPWTTQYQLWQDKLDLSLPKDDNYYMQRGRDLEPVARDAYIALTGNQVYSRQVFHPTIRYMMANMDGITDDNSIAVEIKCPGETDHLLAKEGLVPEKYLPQLQHQLAVIGLNEIHYFSYRDDDTALIIVKRDDKYIKKLLIEERKFWECVENLTPPPLSDRDYDFRVDDDWESIATLWLEANRALEDAKNNEAVIRDKLIALSNSKNSIGAGVRLQSITRKGAVDYVKVSKIYDIDVELYRKKDIESWRLVKY